MPKMIFSILSLVIQIGVATPQAQHAVPDTIAQGSAVIVEISQFLSQNLGDAEDVSATLDNAALPIFIHSNTLYAIVFTDYRKPVGTYGLTIYEDRAPAHQDTIRVVSGEFPEVHYTKTYQRFLNLRN